MRSGVYVKAYLNKEQAMPNHPVSYYAERRQALMDQYMPGGKAAIGPDHPSTDGVHHLALVCSDLQRTIEFYTDVLKMPLVKIVPNRDEPTSTQSGSRAGLLPPSPLRTARMAFTVGRSSLSNALLRTRWRHVQRLVMDLSMAVGM
jgi:hypothetical protein